MGEQEFENKVRSRVIDPKMPVPPPPPPPRLKFEDFIEKITWSDIEEAEEKRLGEIRLGPYEGGVTRDIDGFILGRVNEILRRSGLYSPKWMGDLKYERGPGFDCDEYGRCGFTADIQVLDPSGTQSLATIGVYGEAVYENGEYDVKEIAVLIPTKHAKRLKLGVLDKAVCRQKEKGKTGEGNWIFMYECETPLGIIHLDAIKIGENRYKVKSILPKGFEAELEMPGHRLKDRIEKWLVETLSVRKTPLIL